MNIQYIRRWIFGDYQVYLGAPLSLIRTAKINNTTAEAAKIISRDDMIF